MSKCIFCKLESVKKSIEHIIPESFGNKSYILKNGCVCDRCNNRFSKFESTALSNTVFVMERTRLGAESKKGKSAKGKVGELTIEGDKDLKPEIITVKGLNSKNVRNYDPKTKTFQLVVQTFDDSDVATSKMLLKIGLEAIYKSQKLIYFISNFKILKSYLLSEDNNDWPFLTTDIETKKFRNIPHLFTKKKLIQIHCVLKFTMLNRKTLLFKFKYGSVSMLINLLSRDLDWIKEFKKVDTKAVLYPAHFINKLEKK